MADALPARFGFVHGRTDGLVWLRAPDGRYKRLNPELLELLRDLSRGERRPAELDAGARAAAAQLAREGFLVPDAPLEERVTPPDLRLAPRLLLFGGLLALTAGLVWVRRDLCWPPPDDPLNNIIAIPFFIAAALLHELGHYAASRPYFRPRIRLGLLNRVIPAVLTLTNDAWACPRGVRVWINLAGPLVDLVLALGVLLVHLTLLPQLQVLNTILLVQLIRVLFVLNPLIEGDGYWCLTDLLGLVNLRTRGFADLRRLRPSGYAAYALLSLGFTACCLLLLARVLVALFGWL